MRCVPSNGLDQHARSVLVVENLILAKWVAGRFVGRGLDRDDLNQAAVLGLMRAAERFDPERGCKFTTYATWWCRQAVMRAIENESRIIRLPSYVSQALGRRARAADHGETLPEPSSCERAAKRALRICSGDDGNERPFEPLHEAAGPTDAAQDSECTSVVRVALGGLPERLRTIIVRRFGLGCEPETLEQIGRRLGISRERVRQLEADALAMLRESDLLPTSLFE